MRILHVITMLDIGGAERLMVDLLPLLQEKGNDVDLLLLDGVETPFKKEIKQKGIKILELSRGVDVNNRSKVYNPLNILKLRKYIRQYDIIHTHNTASQFFVPLSRVLTCANTALVTTEHNSTNRRRDIQWFRPLDKWMYKQYNTIICIADQAQNNLEEYLGRKKGITTIYNGVDVKKFLQPIHHISSNEAIIITMVAAFREQKDHETMLRSMLCLQSNYHLQFVGGGEKEEQIKSLCTEMGLNERVSFLGHRSDISNILKNSDIVVLSSHWEGLSLSSIEGMASGHPFVASDVDGLREIVSDAGILFPEGDEHALAEAIQRLCSNPDLYKTVAMRCQERAQKYDISVMANGYDKLYNSLKCSD